MPNSAQVNWEDIRYVLAVADHGSVAAAARALAVNHATVLRRIAAFEARQGIRVFDRTPRGYRLSADRRALVEAMRGAADALTEVDRMIDAERPRLGSGIRLTSTDAFCQAVLPPMIARVSAELGVAVDVLAGNAHLDLGRFQAHVTVRPALRLPDDLTGERAGEFRFGIYAAPGAGAEWLGLSGPLSRSSAGTWMQKHLGAGDETLSADSFTMLAALAAEGRGRTLLPVFLGDGWPGLVRTGMPADLAPVPIWVASHQDFARSGRLVRFRSRLVDELLAARERLMG